MAHTICKKCNIIFNKNGKDYCDECSRKIDTDYDKVMEYLKFNPRATVIDVILDTGVSLKTINLFVKEGFISYVENNDYGSSLEFTEKLGKVLHSEGKFYSRRLAD